jgi:hypothetical protein
VTERLALEELLGGGGDDVTSAANRDEALRWVLDRPGVTCLTKPIAFTELHRRLRPTHTIETRAP